MKIVILAGGLGTRLSEETDVRPKPMVEIGGRPIIWHIMKLYHSYGFKDFVICLGYKGYIIKEYFSNYKLHMSDVSIDTSTGKIQVLENYSENWTVTLVESGADTMTGGRLKRVRKYLGDDDFFLTYGDGLSDVNISELLMHHRSEKRLATITAVQPPGRFGLLEIDNGCVADVVEKPSGDGVWINGGFFVLNPKVIDYISGDETIWEQVPLRKLAKEGHLTAYQHRGFWQPMDTLRDKQYLEKLWNGGNAPWKLW